jgi:hypothetical protein
MSSLRTYLAGFRASSASLGRGEEPQIDSAGDATTQIRGPENSEDSEVWVTAWEDVAGSVWPPREYFGPWSKEFGAVRAAIPCLPGRTNWSGALIALGYADNTLRHATIPSLR